VLTQVDTDILEEHISIFRVEEMRVIVMRKCERWGCGVIT